MKPFVAKTAATADRQLLVVTMVLVAIGIIMVYSASSVISERLYNNPTAYLKKELFRVFIGIATMAVLSRIDYHLLRRIAFPALLISAVPLVITLIPILAGKGAVKGASRWVSFSGAAFQPSEFMKLALIVYLAHYLTTNEALLKDLKRGFIKALLVPLPFLVVLVLQPNYGMTISLLIILFLMLWIAGVKIRHLCGIGGAALPIMALLLITSEHAAARLHSFISSAPDSRGAGYQILQSLIALGNGGITGLGLGQSRQKFFYLPEAHTDFIFAVIGEEIGIIGTIAVVLLFGWFAWRGLRIARRADDRFGTMLAFGLTSMIFVFAAVNIGVVVKLLPTTGLPLPFISYGGSAMVVNLAAVGILLNISRHLKIGINEPIIIPENIGETDFREHHFVRSRRNGRAYNPGAQYSTRDRREGAGNLPREPQRAGA